MSLAGREIAGFELKDARFVRRQEEAIRSALGDGDEPAPGQAVPFFPSAPGGERAGEKNRSRGDGGSKDAQQGSERVASASARRIVGSGRK